MTAPVPKPRYGREVIGQRVRVQDAATKLWRTGTIKHYHGGYLRHTIVPEGGGEEFHAHLHVDGCEFLLDNADPVPDVVGSYVSVAGTGPDKGRWHTGQAIAFDGLTHTLKLPDGSCHYVNLRKQDFKTAQQPPPAAAAAAGSGGGAKRGGSVGPQQQPAAAASSSQQRASAGGASAGGPASRRAGSASGGGGKEGSPGAAGAAAAAGDKPRRPTPLSLNMSHASQKDREAARALLAFSVPADEDEGATTTAAQPTPAALIANAVAKAAQKAGLPDPSSTTPIDPEGGDDLLAAASLTLEATGGEQQQQQQRAGSQPPAPAAAGGGEGEGEGGAGVEGALQRALESLQLQMAKLAKQDERRSLDAVRLKAQLRDALDDRDDAMRGREKATAALDLAEDRIDELRDDNRILKTQVETLTRENSRLQARLRAATEGGAAPSAASRTMGAAALQGQLSSIRQEMATCKAESAQLLTQLRTFAALASGQDPAAVAAAAAAALASLPPPPAYTPVPPPPAIIARQPSATSSGRIPHLTAKAAANSAAAQTQRGTGRRKNAGRGGGGQSRLTAAAAAAAAVGTTSAAVVTPDLMMDRAAAAALAAPPSVLHMQAQSRGQVRVNLANAAAALPASGMMGQLRQVLPGKMVFGPVGGMQPAGRITLQQQFSGGVMSPPAATQPAAAASLHSPARSAAAGRQPRKQQQRQQLRSSSPSCAAASDASAAAAGLKRKRSASPPPASADASATPAAAAGAAATAVLPGFPDPAAAAGGGVVAEAPAGPDEAHQQQQQQQAMDVAAEEGGRHQDVDAAAATGEADQDGQRPAQRIKTAAEGAGVLEAGAATAAARPTTVTGCA